MFVSLWFPGPTAEVRRTCTSVSDDSFRVTQNYYCHETQWVLFPAAHRKPSLQIWLFLLCTQNFFFFVFVFKFISKLKGSGCIYQSSPGLLTCTECSWWGIPNQAAHTAGMAVLIVCGDQRNKDEIRGFHHRWGTGGTWEFGFS